jgi:hypothetical protein
MDLRYFMWKAVDRIHPDQGRGCWQALVNMVMNLQVPKKAIS